MAYDDSNRLIRHQTDGPPADGAPDIDYQYTYDDATGKETRVSYDDTPGDGVPRYYRYSVYDTAGNLISLWYDDDPFDEVPDATENRTYDPEGRLLLVEIDRRPADGVPDAIDTYTYDDYGNLLQRLKEDVDWILPECWSYVYNDEGQVISDTHELECVPGGISFTNFYEYDENGYLSRETSEDGEVTTYVHDADGRLLEASYCYEDCVFTEWIYDEHFNLLYEIHVWWPMHADLPPYVDELLTYTYDCWG